MVELMLLVRNALIGGAEELCCSPEPAYIAAVIRGQRRRDHVSVARSARGVMSPSSPPTSLPVRRCHLMEPRRPVDPRDAIRAWDVLDCGFASALVAGDENDWLDCRLLGVGWGAEQRDELGFDHAAVVKRRAGGGTQAYRNEPGAAGD